MRLLQEITDMLNGTDVAGRQDRQWQNANDALDEARALLSNDSTTEDHMTALATAVTGLLALQLSRT